MTRSASLRVALDIFGCFAQLIMFSILELWMSRPQGEADISCPISAVEKQSGVSSGLLFHRARLGCCGVVGVHRGRDNTPSLCL